MPGRGPRDGTRARAFLGDTRGDMVRGVCRVALKLGSERYVIHVGKGATCSTLVV